MDQADVAGADQLDQAGPGVFEEWFDRFGGLELAEPPERFRNTNVNGIKRMLVRAALPLG